MDEFNPQPGIVPNVLATDLDGTFIPLPENEDNVAALKEISRQREETGFKLVYSTGRHYSSVSEAIVTCDLPHPDWLVCDVGSSIYHREHAGENFRPFAPYIEHLDSISDGVARERVESALNNVAKIKLQSSERQERFKISYECASAQLEGALASVGSLLEDSGLPYEATGSVDPFENCGLIDVMPSRVSKAYALTWLSRHADFSPDEVVFCGDSGNDRAALVSGMRAVLVGNATEDLRQSVLRELEDRGLRDRLYLARGLATSGVLEGCRHFGLIKGS